MDKQPKSLISRLLEIAVMFAIATYLIRLGAYYIADVWPILVIIIAVIVTAIVIYRLWRHHNNAKW